MPRSPSPQQLHRKLPLQKHPAHRERTQTAKQPFPQTGVHSLPLLASSHKSRDLTAARCCVAHCVAGTAHAKPQLFTSLPDPRLDLGRASWVATLLGMLEVSPIPRSHPPQPRGCKEQKVQCGKAAAWGEAEPCIAPELV